MASLVEPMMGSRSIFARPEMNGEASRVHGDKREKLVLFAALEGLVRRVDDQTANDGPEILLGKNDRSLFLHHFEPSVCYPPPQYKAAGCSPLPVTLERLVIGLLGRVVAPTRQAMAESSKISDISMVASAARSLTRSDTQVRVPRYSLYGDAAPSREWFVNVEPLDQRASALGWEIAPHTHPKFTQLVFVADGSGEMTLDGDVSNFSGPTVLVIPPFRIHGFRYAERTAGQVVTIENNYLGDLLTRGPDLRVVLEAAGAYPLSIGAHEAVGEHLDVLTRELAATDRGGGIAAEIELLQIVLIMLRDRPTTDISAPTARAKIVDRFLQIVEARYRDQPEIDELACELGVSAAQLRTACNEAMGLPPLAILHDRIAAEAKRCLVYSTSSISEIGYSLGFKDAAYFSRFIARTLGVAPSKFRRGVTRS